MANLKMNKKTLIISAGIVVLLIIAVVKLSVIESARIAKLKEKYSTQITEPTKPENSILQKTKKNELKVDSVLVEQAETTEKIESIDNQIVDGQNVIKYQSTEFENGSKTYYQNTDITIDADNNTITFTDNTSFTFVYHTYSEITDLFIGEKRIGIKIMIRNHKLLKSVSLFLIGGLPENSILQEYHDGTMLEYFGISEIQ